MPIEIEKLDKHIYRSKWIGDVTLGEILGGRIQQMARQAGESYYIAILDATELRGFPFNARGLRRGDEVYSRALVTLIVKPPLLGRVLADIVSRLTKMRFEYYDTLDEALARAKIILAEHHERQGVS